MSKHTPGPWAVNGWGSIVPQAHLSRHVGGSVHDDRDLAEYQQEIAHTRFGCERHKSAEEVAANARLIAAAPDMYEAGKLILDILDHPTRSVSALDADKLRAALAKAEAK